MPDILEYLKRAAGPIWWHAVAFLRLALAVGCAAVIGLERERREKRAGLRTHILICAGACLFTLVGLRMRTDFAGSDPIRLVQALVIGVGFLGGGVIFTKGASVRGLTTAAGLWVLTGIGLAAGLGYYALAIFATALAFGVIVWVKKIEPRLHDGAGPQGPPQDQ
ncbi:MAG: MgtC/SapB family protein [Candidatus Brocadiia bacterium]|jgi:putative Mg2+ transporter-C (MgtC) family protein|nr:MgtC/SapB family protein [Candidatus Brocadiia bacterium]